METNFGISLFIYNRNLDYIRTKMFPTGIGFKLVFFIKGGLKTKVSLKPDISMKHLEKMLQFLHYLLPKRP